MQHVNLRRPRTTRAVSTTGKPERCSPIRSAGGPADDRWVAWLTEYGHGSGPQRRSQLRVSVGLAPTSPAPRCRPESREPHAASGVHATAVERALYGGPMNSVQTTPERPWHSVTWLVWAIAATATLQIAPSPVYVALVIAIATLVVSTYGLDTPYARAYPILVGRRDRVRAAARRAHRAHDARRTATSSSPCRA